jgi:hypothetical protein
MWRFRWRRLAHPRIEGAQAVGRVHNPPVRRRNPRLEEPDIYDNGFEERRDSPADIPK